MASAWNVVLYRTVVPADTAVTNGNLEGKTPCVKSAKEECAGKEIQSFTQSRYTCSYQCCKPGAVHDCKSYTYILMYVYVISVYNVHTYIPSTTSANPKIKKRRRCTSGWF